MPNPKRPGLCAAAVALALLGLLPVHAESERPRLIRDINPKFYPASSDPHAFHQVGDETLFFAVWRTYTSQFGGFGRNVMWKTDGTRDGTSLVAVGTSAVLWEPEDAVEFRRRLYYGNQFGLWMSTGTVRGTIRIKEVDSAEEFIVMGNAFYFRAEDPQHGEELWRSDGTTSGTALLADIRPGSAGSRPGQFVVLDGLLYFVADGSLWRSDGTAAGTQLVHYHGTNWNPYGLTAALGQLFFQATTGAGAEPWVYDPPNEWTHQLRDIHAGGSSSPFEFTEVNGTVYFSAEDATHGRKLWKSDGTWGGTLLVTDGPGSSEPYWLTAFGDTLIYHAGDPSHGKELWKSDGTPGGTRMIADIWPGAESSWPVFLTALDDRVLFDADDGVSGSELWATDGETAFLVRDIRPGTNYHISDMTVSNGLLYFSATDEHGSEPWVSDGTTEGTFMLKDLDAQTDAAFDGYDRVVEVGDELYFRATDGLHGGELWKTDGTWHGTHLVRDILPGPDPPLWRGAWPLAAVGDRLIFMADDGIHGWEPWITDGSTGGTMLLKDITPGPDGTGIYSGAYAVFEGALFFGASDSIHGSELWRSDGTPAGTELFSEIVPGPDGSFPRQFAVLEDALVFEARYPGLGDELWANDGTPEGTRLLADIRPGPDSCWMDELTVAGGEVYFSARDGNVGDELWASDGTPEGTRLVKDIYPGGYGSGPDQLTAAAGRLFFVAADSAEGNELWVTDGTPLGTNRVTDILAPGEIWESRSMIASGGSVFFDLRDDDDVPILWTSDGTAEGTIPLPIRVAGSQPVDPKLMVDVDGVVYVAAEHPRFGDEIWKTDGTVEGSVFAYDIAPGPRPSFPALLGAFDGELYFTANDWLHGNELWAATINRRPVAVCEDVNVHAGSDGYADADVDGGSYDPDGEIIAWRQRPPGPYGVGVTAVTLTVHDDDRASDSCSAQVTVSSTDPSHRTALPRRSRARSLQKSAFSRF